MTNLTGRSLLAGVLAATALGFLLGATLRGWASHGEAIVVTLARTGGWTCF